MSRFDLASLRKLDQAHHLHPFTDHRAMHAVIDRQRNHGIHWRVLAKWLRMAGGDHVHNGTVVGKLEGNRLATMAINDLLREDHIPEDPARGLYFAQSWASLAPVFPAASGGIHVWHMPELVSIFGDDAVFQFGGGTAGHPQGNAAGASANRVALEAVLKARNEGRDIVAEGKEILLAAAAHAPELRMALDTWREIAFEFDEVDRLDPATVPA